MNTPLLRLKTGIGWITLLGYGENMIGIEGRNLTLHGVRYDIDARYYRHGDEWSLVRPEAMGGEGVIELYITRCDGLPVNKIAITRLRDLGDRDYQFAIRSNLTLSFRRAARLYGLETERIIAEWEYSVFAARVEQARRRMERTNQVALLL